MPTYQYKCKECGKEFEYFQSMSEPSLTEWPKEIKKECLCTSGVVRKIGMGSGIILRGTGFYETDYVKKSGTPTSKPTVNANNPSSNTNSSSSGVGGSNSNSDSSNNSSTNSGGSSSNITNTTNSSSSNSNSSSKTESNNNTKAN